MTDKIFFDGVEYMSSVEAGREFNVTNDYIARFCRNGDIKAKRVGQHWYVNRISLQAYFLQKDHIRQSQREQLAQKRAQEYKSLNHARKVTVPPVVPSVRRSAAVTKVAAEFVAFVGAILLTAGLYSYADNMRGQLITESGTVSHGRLASAAISFLDIPHTFVQTALSGNATIDNFIYSLFGHSTTPADIAQYQTTHDPQISLRATSTPTPAVVLPPAPTRTIVERVIERVVERTLPIYTTVNNGGITQDVLDAGLNQLDNKLTGKIFSLSASTASVPGSLPASGGFTNSIALTQRIDKLSGTTITNPTISGGSISNVSLSTADLSGVVAVTKGGTGTSTAPTYGQLLVGDSSGGFNLLATSSLGVSSPPGGSDTQVQFNNNSAFGGDATFTFSTTTKQLGATGAAFTNSTTTNSTSTYSYSSLFTATNATSTNFFSSNASTTNATSTSLFAVLGHFTTGVIDTLSSAVATITSLTATNLVATNSTTTNATSTNLFASRLLANVASFGQTGTTTITSTGALGVGTTTPSASLSVQNNYASGNTMLFAVASSTASNGSSASTFFSIDTFGTTTIGNSSGTGDANFQFASDTNAWSTGYRSSDKAFVIASSTNMSGTAAFAIAKNGNTTIVGSGTTCVIGSGTGATSCTSDERLKTNITSISGTDALAKLAAIQGVTFNWSDPSRDQNEQVGVIAQDVLQAFPQLVGSTTVNFKGAEGVYYTVNYDGLISPLISGVNELNVRTSGLRADNANDIAPLSATTSATELTTASSSVATSTPWVASFASASDRLNTDILSLSDTVVHVLARAVYATTGVFERIFVKELTAKNIYADTVTAKVLCLDDVCVTKTQLQALLNSQSASVSAAIGNSSPAQDGPPVISVSGNNPAIVNVGISYSDLGATITGPQADLNLGINVSVDGGATTTPDAVHIDTSTPGAHTIVYHATDQNGLTGTATRTVTVTDPSQSAGGTGTASSTAPTAGNGASSASSTAPAASI